MFISPVEEKTHLDQTRSDEELWQLAGDELLNSHGWTFHNDHPDLNDHDYDRIYEVADSCNTCGIYHDPCEYDENGNCDTCQMGYEEE